MTSVAFTTSALEKGTWALEEGQQGYACEMLRRHVLVQLPQAVLQRARLPPVTELATAAETEFINGRVHSPYASRVC